MYHLFVSMPAASGAHPGSRSGGTTRARPRALPGLAALAASALLAACGAAGGGDLDHPATLDALRAEAAAVSPPAPGAGPQLRAHQLFVDPETRFAFIHLPGHGRTGWKFVGQLDASSLERLPPDTLTSLLPAEPGAERVARPDEGPQPDAGLSSGRPRG